VKDEEGNLFFSPYSLSQALAMVYGGARGQTAQQMAETLHFTLPQERLHPAFNALDLDLSSRSQPDPQAKGTTETPEPAFELHIANAVWAQEGYPYLPDYLDILAQNYGAGLRLVDFKGSAEKMVAEINRWVSEQTEGRIQEILDQLDPDTLLVLANAVYFNADWDNPFDEELTQTEPFYPLDGPAENTPLMHQTENFPYAEGDGYQAVELPYANRDFTMVILLPREGQFQEIEAQLSGEWVQGVVQSLQNREVILTLPKYRFETPAISLKETLSAMGMSDAFAKNADFFGIIEQRPGLKIYLGKVLHKAFIDVNEKKTEAAAVSVVIVTVVVGIPVEIGPPPVEMRIDRPFIFFIRDNKTNTILFLGRVMNPVVK
jgi:serpin B